MSKKLTEEELDAKFEEFMQKLSTDEETSHSLSITKENKVETKDKLWWLKDDTADNNKSGASKPSLISWLKPTPKTLSTETASKAGLIQPAESVANVPLDIKEPAGYRGEISGRDNSALTTESSKTETNSHSVNSNTSQILTGGGDYSEDFESGNLNTRASNKRAETQGDAKSENEQLSTSGDLTLNSGSSDAESSSADEKSSQLDGGSDKATNDHLQVREESSKSSDKDISKRTTSENVSTGARIEQLEKEVEHFGQETFVMKSNSRGIDEILKEAEEIERSNVQSVSGESRSSHRKEVDWTTSIQKPPKSVEYPEPGTGSLAQLTKSSNFHIANVDNLNLQQLLKEERRRYAKLQVEVSAQENDCKQRLEKQRVLYEEKLLQLEAENVHLASKIDELRQKSATDVKKADMDDDGLVMDKANKLRKGFKEQEQLIVGYQRENEQLYDQLKNLKNELKSVRGDYDEENRRLLSELATVKRNLQRSDVGAREKTLFSSVRDEMQLKIEALLQEIEFLKTENANLSHRQFLANNLRDSATSNLKGNTAEVTDLKTKILGLENEIRKKNLEQSSAATMLAAKETRIESLKKQVKQLEQLVSVRHPNSLSALVLAAGGAGDGERQHRTVQFLEDRVCELEEKLSSRNTDDNSSLKGIEEQYTKLKEHYEARIAHLEERRGVAKSATSHPQSSVTALEKELDSIRERHRKETERMKNEIAALRQEIKHKTAIHRSGDHGLAIKMRSMSTELTTKDKQIKILQQKLDELKSSPLPSPSKLSFGQSRKPFAGAISNKVDGNDVEEENRMLKSKVQQLIGQVEYLRGMLQETRQKSKDVQEDGGPIKNLEDEIAVKRMELGEANARLRRANEDLSEIRCRNEILELVTSQLRERLAIVQVDSEQIKRLRAENAELRLQCYEFHERLVMAEAAHPLEWKHYAMLQARVNEVEKKYRDKSNELLAMADHYRKNVVNAQPNESVLQTEVNQWKALVEKRNREIEGFRDQIDEIIVALESLHAEVYGKRKGK